MPAEYPQNQFCRRLKFPNLLGSLIWASGLIPLDCLYLKPLQRHFHSLGLTHWFTPPRCSDSLVLANLLRQWQDLSCHTCTSKIPIQPLQVHDFYGCFYPGGGSGTWGSPTVDMFATGHNMHLPQFMSPILEPRALAIDALSQEHQGRSMFMFPPFQT